MITRHRLSKAEITDFLENLYLEINSNSSFDMFKFMEEKNIPKYYSHILFVLDIATFTGSIKRRNYEFSQVPDDKMVDKVVNRIYEGKRRTVSFFREQYSKLLYLKGLKKSGYYESIKNSDSNDLNGYEKQLQKELLAFDKEPTYTILDAIDSVNTDSIDPESLKNNDNEYRNKNLTNPEVYFKALKKLYSLLEYTNKIPMGKFFKKYQLRTNCVQVLIKGAIIKVEGTKSNRKYYWNTKEPCPAMSIRLMNESNEMYDNWRREDNERQALKRKKLKEKTEAIKKEDERLKKSKKYSPFDEPIKERNLYPKQSVYSTINEEIIEPEFKNIIEFPNEESFKPSEQKMKAKSKNTEFDADYYIENIVVAFPKILEKIIPIIPEIHKHISPLIKTNQQAESRLNYTITKYLWGLIKIKRTYHYDD